jgi:hypothetical protein
MEKDEETCHVPENQRSTTRWIRLSLTYVFMILVWNTLLLF